MIHVKHPDGNTITYDNLQDLINKYSDEHQKAIDEWYDKGIKKGFKHGVASGLFIAGCMWIIWAFIHYAAR